MAEKKKKRERTVDDALNDALGDQSYYEKATCILADWRELTIGEMRDVLTAMTDILEGDN